MENGLFDVANSSAGVDAKNDPLVRIDEAIPERNRRAVDKAVDKEARQEPIRFQESSRRGPAAQADAPLPRGDPDVTVLRRGVYAKLALQF